MDYAKIGELVFFLIIMAPGLIVGVLVPLVDIRYGNTYLFGAFFDRTLYRDEHPLWFWLVEAIQLTIGVAMLSQIAPLVMPLVKTLTP